MPSDPEGTLQRVTGGTLRVGVSENPPWTTQSEPPTGSEPLLVEELARRLPARIEWHPGAESVLVDRLRAGELDLVIGGLRPSSPWSREVGMTQPYPPEAEEPHVMAVRQGENRWLLTLDRFLQSETSGRTQNQPGTP